METEDWSGGSSDLEVASAVSDNEYDLGDSPKLQHRNNVTKAHWKEELGMAEIVSIKGPRWRTTGIVRDGKIYAFLEDALFLAEIGALHLLDDKDECIPLKDIYMKVAQGIGGLSWESLEVYKHLKSLGYIVKRHGVCWTMKHAKRAPASVEGELGSQRIIDNGSEDISSITEITELFRAVKIKDEVRPVFDVYPPNSMFKKSSPGDPMFILCINHGNPSTKEQIEDLERQCEGIPLLFCYVEHGRVSYMILHMVSPMTHVVGNYVKRVVVIVSSVIFFQTPVSPVNSLGTGLALAGVFMYSRVKRIKSKPKTD